MITQAQARQLFAYDPLTGIVTARTNRPGRSPKIGEPVGSPHKNGYLSVMVNGKNYMLHRVIWLLVHGVFPPADLDHRNGRRSDNRLDNLRPATRAQNNQNMTRRSNNQSGEPGVRRVGNRWRVLLTAHGVHHHIGYFSVFEEAVAAKLDAKKKIHLFQPTPRAQ